MTRSTARWTVAQVLIGALVIDLAWTCWEQSSACRCGTCSAAGAPPPMTCPPDADWEER